MPYEPPNRHDPEEDRVLQIVTALAIKFDLFEKRFQDYIDSQKAPRPTRIVLGFPTTTRKGIPVMANFPMKNDLVYFWPIHVANAAGQIVPADPADVFSANSSNPTSVGVAVGPDANGATCLIGTPAVQGTTGIVLTVSDSSGLKVQEITVDVGPDNVATQIEIDTVDFTTTTQAVPAAPGP